jgi:hypothetical protein
MADHRRAPPGALSPSLPPRSKPHRQRCGPKVVPSQSVTNYSRIHSRTRAAQLPRHRKPPRLKCSCISFVIILRQKNARPFACVPARALIETSDAHYFHKQSKYFVSLALCRGTIVVTESAWMIQRFDHVLRLPRRSQ